MRSSSRDADALVALSRFGLGPRPGDRRRVASDPRGAVAAELDRAGVARIDEEKLVGTELCFRLLVDRRALQALRDGADVNGQLATAAAMMRAAGRLPQKYFAKLDAVRKGPAPQPPAVSAAGGPVDALLKRNAFPYEDELAARLVQARDVGIGFVERLVMFWANHFTVSITGDPYVWCSAGAFEREAIRPHVLGRFGDMLTAATRHPTMLKFLQNDQSFGPNSVAGRQMKIGLNENHARELLELHTLGVDGGYTQGDVTALALAMTGWRTPLDPSSGSFGRFGYNPDAHEPGDRTIMGRVYRDFGERQADAAIDDFGRNPATARHLARRFATAFVADDPPDALVERLAANFRDTGGDLKAFALTLVRSDEAWEAPRTKMRSPQEFALSLVRMLPQTPDLAMLKGGLEALGQQFWGAPSPKGFTLLGRDWIAPDAQTNRLDLAVQIAAVQPETIDPPALADDLFGDVLSDESLTAVKRAGSREQALALLMMCPEMQRR